MELYLIRHGESYGNVNGYLSGAVDPPLTELGRRQAQYAAERIAAMSVDALYCGPLQRNLETAACICRTSGLRAELMPALFEVGGNQLHWEREDLQTRFPDVVIPPEAVPWNQQELETREEAGERAAGLIEELRERHLDGATAVALVCHGTLGVLFVERLMGWPYSGRTAFSTGNCAIHWIEWQQDHVKIRKLNDECHIPEADRS